MTQAEVTNSLRQKDTEKTLALEEIKTAKASLASGFIGKLYVSLVGVRGFDGQSSGANLTYTLSPADHGEAAPADEVPMNVTPPVEAVQQEVVEDEQGKEADTTTVATTASYYAEFDCKELPEEGYMQLELIGKNEGQLFADLKFVIKVSYEEFEKVILHKMIELEQIQQQMKDLNNSVKDASRSKTGKVKKQKKVASGEKNTAQYTSEGEDVGPSKFEIARNTAEAVAVFVLTTRSYWLFGAAAVGIMYFGEYASI